MRDRAALPFTLNAEQPNAGFGLGILDSVMSIVKMEQRLKTAPQWSFSMASSAYFLTLLAVGVLLLNLLVVSLALLSLYQSRNQ